MAQWVVRNADGEFMVLSNGDPSLIHTEPANYSLVEVAGGDCPDPQTEKWGGKAVVKKTVAEVTAYDAAQQTKAVAALCATPLVQALLKTVSQASGVAVPVLEDGFKQAYGAVGVSSPTKVVK